MENKNIEYKGYIINSASVKSTETGCWTTDLTITKHRVPGMKHWKNVSVLSVTMPFRKILSSTVLILGSYTQRLNLCSIVYGVLHLVFPTLITVRILLPVKR